MKATGTYAVKKWTENPYEQISETMRMTKASVEYSMSGEIVGTATVEYLMFYQHFDAKDQHASTAQYVGLIWFVGSVNGKEGSFAMEDRGTFNGGAAKSLLLIIAGSGTGELSSISGSGMYSADQNGITIALDYTL